METEAGSGLATVKRWAAIPLVITGGVAAVVTGQFSSLAVAEGVGLTVVMTLFTTLLWWPLRQIAISWIVIASVFVVHLLVVFAIPWPIQHRASKLILLIFLVDVFSVIIISDKLERRNRADRHKGARTGS